MTKLTNPHVLTDDWAAISTGGANVLVSMNPEAAGRSEILVAGAAEELTNADRGHQMFPTASPAINFYGLPDTAIVYARKRINTDVILDVTEF